MTGKVENDCLNCGSPDKIYHAWCRNCYDSLDTESKWYLIGFAGLFEYQYKDEEDILARGTYGHRDILISALHAYRRGCQDRIGEMRDVEDSGDLNGTD